MKRSVAVGVFDGVHVGHRAVLDAVVAAGTPRVVTLDPHPVPDTPLICGLERRLELLHEGGVEDVRVAPLESWIDAAQLEGAILVTGHAPYRPLGGEEQHTRSQIGELVVVPVVDGVSSEDVRRLVAARELEAAARMLGRPFELEGQVVEGDRRGRGLGFPTANLRVPRQLLLPPYGIYAGAALGHRAAVSIGVNPHYGAEEQRVEAYLLDFAGDLYGARLVVQLWAYLHEERAFESEADLVASIEADVAAARTASPPA